MSVTEKNKGVIGDDLLKNNYPGGGKDPVDISFKTDEELYDIHKAEDRFFDLQKAEWCLIKELLTEELRNRVENKMIKKGSALSERESTFQEIFALKDEIEQASIIGNMTDLSIRDKEGNVVRKTRKKIDFEIYEKSLKSLRAKLAILFSQVRWADEFILESVPGFMEKPQSKKMMH